MIKQQVEENIQKIADYYGCDNQTNKTIEECAEVIQALVKLKYSEEMYEDEYDIARKNVIEEMADVQIMLKQMFYLLDCEKEVEKAIEYKINRQLERIRQVEEQ